MVGCFPIWVAKHQIGETGLFQFRQKATGSVKGVLFRPILGVWGVLFHHGFPQVVQ